jgi:hypothetical protein
MKGFSQTCCNWVNHFVSKGCVGIKVNDDVGCCFQTKKGLRQGDPLSALLFNLVADMLTILISRAKEDGQINGLVPHHVNGGLSILQYVDVEQAKNMKLLLCAFEQLFGLKINFHKSEPFCYGEALEWKDQYTELFGC